MRNLGIDVGKKESLFYVLDDAGRKIGSGRVATSEGAFADLVRRYEGDEGVAAALETGNLTFMLSRAMIEAGADVFVVDPYQNALIAQSTKKTDRLDAKQLSNQRRLNMLPQHSVYVPTEQAEALRRLVSARARLVKERTALSNRAIRLAERHGITEIKKGAFSESGAWKRLLNQAAGWPLAMDPVLVRQYAADAARLRLQIRELEEIMIRHLETNFPAETALLRTVPGVGPVTSAALIAHVEEIGRFGSARKMCRYVGLTSAVRKSGKTVSSGHICKCGNSRLRGYLTQAAIHFLRHAQSDDPMVMWYQRLKSKRGWRKARVALARKIAAVCYGVLKHRNPYDPAYGQNVLAKEPSNAGKQDGLTMPVVEQRG
jgi:transposase